MNDVEIDPVVVEREQYISRVFNEHESTSKKSRSASAKASRAGEKMREVAQECREIQATYDNAVDKFNRSARDKFLDYMGQKKTAEEFNLPIEQFLQDDDSSEMRRKI